MDEPTLWKKSSRSAGVNNCVELAWAGAVRDSKNPNGPMLTVALGDMLDAVKADRLNTTR